MSAYRKSAFAFWCMVVVAIALFALGHWLLGALCAVDLCYFVREVKS